jgi:hypothetical protein
MDRGSVTPHRRPTAAPGGRRRCPRAHAARAWAIRIGAIFALAAWGLSAASAASPTPAPLPRIDMKVLLLGTSTTEPDFAMWQVALQREGVPFDAIVTSTAAPNAVSASTLSSTLPDGTPEAKYEAVIVANGFLLTSGSTQSGLSPAEWNALETYESQFNVREIDGDVYPGPLLQGPVDDIGYGLNSPTVTGNMDNEQGTLTADGKAIFPYLTGPVTFGVYPSVPGSTTTYGYEATPAAGANFDTLLTGPHGGSLVGIYSDAYGVQHMVQTYNQNAFLLQAQLLQHGALNWVTRDLYFGDQRNYLETHVDDNFLADAAWSVSGNATTPPHSTDFNPADALREVPADIVNAANWSRQNGFRIDMLFNGGGSVAVANGDSLVGAGDAGSGGTGSTTGSGGAASGTDPLLAQFTASDSSTGKSYANDFAWISHTWDHPNIDEGCATQNYIEAEVNQNAAWATRAASGAGDPINGGLGLSSSTSATASYGTLDPQAIVVGEHSGIPNLIPGNPGQVDPPSIDSADVTLAGGTLAAGQYVYAMADRFNTAAPGQAPVATGGESAASVSAPVTVTAPSSVTLTWDAVCHAGTYAVYRAPDVAGTIGAWSLIGTVNANTSTDFVDPSGGSTTSTAGGGAIAKAFTDTGIAGTPTGSSGAPTPTSTPGTEGHAVESAYEQNPVLDAAFAATTGGGIKYFGSDASKPYPIPADGAFPTGSPPAGRFAPGQPFGDAGGIAVPRYPTNIYYNVSTNAQEIDEYQTLYDLPTCVPVAGVTTCNPAGTQFTLAQIVASGDQQMFQHVMGNDPRPHYFHQTNLMAQTNQGVNGNGDGLFYETMNPLLAGYRQYFAANAPIVQATMPQIATLLADQASWAANTQVRGWIQGGTVTVTNSGAPAQVPLTGIPSVGAVYGGIQSGWTTMPTGTTTFNVAGWPTKVNQLPPPVLAPGQTATVLSAGPPVAKRQRVFNTTLNKRFGALRLRGRLTGSFSIADGKGVLISVTASQGTFTVHAGRAHGSVSGVTGGLRESTRRARRIEISSGDGHLVIDVSYSGARKVSASAYSVTFSASRAPITARGGQSASARLSLITVTGAPLGHAAVTVTDAGRIATVTTAANGTSPFTIGAGPDRTISLAYAGTAQYASSSLAVPVHYHAWGTIRLASRKLPAAGPARFTGKVFGADGKPASLAVKLQYLTARGIWRTSATVRSKPGGTWTASVAWPRSGHAGGGSVPYRVVVAGFPSATINASLP